MGQRYRQFSFEERCEIARLQGEGRSLRQIAASLDRAPSSVARELKRNSGVQVGYKPAYAQQQTKARRWSGSKLDRQPQLRELVLDRLSAEACRHPDLVILPFQADIEEDLLMLSSEQAPLSAVASAFAALLRQAFAG